jgi:hypothetical protein
MLVETDASDYALAGIISSMTPDSEIHPIAFHSCTFTDTEHNYNTHDKELLCYRMRISTIIITNDVN